MFPAINCYLLLFRYFAIFLLFCLFSSIFLCILGNISTVINNINIKQLQTIIIMIHKILIILYALLVVHAMDQASFSKSQIIYSQFSKLPTTSTVPPPKQLTVQEEHEEYIRDFKLTSFQADLHTQFKLNKDRTGESVFFLAMKETTLTIEILVSGTYNKQSQLEISSKPVLCYLVDRQTKQIVKNYLIQKQRLIVLENLADKLYELKISLQLEDNQEYLDKVVTVQGIVEAQDTNDDSSEWIRQYQKKINVLYDESVEVFLDSLEAWTQIQQASNKYRKNQMMWKTYSLVQLLAFTILSIAQMAYMRRLLQTNSII